MVIGHLQIATQVTSVGGRLFRCGRRTEEERRCSKGPIFFHDLPSQCPGGLRPTVTFNLGTGQRHEEEVNVIPDLHPKGVSAKAVRFPLFLHEAAFILDRSVLKSPLLNGGLGCEATDL